MEDNNDVPNASASETQPTGVAGEEISDLAAIFGNDDSGIFL